MLSEELGIMTQVSELFLISLETKKSYTRDSSPAGTDLFISFAHASLGFAITFQAYSLSAAWSPKPNLLAGFPSENL
jgi:hypothetical protein